ncbi:sigma-70 family RNA polymerase sigma factor [Streptomyces termitum]|uniref:sigma-70 family RNA polymerase sigma factor n=1 Tax=Streptomyces termitum TaxID=67368 RepID=UPI0037A5E0BA
MTTVTARAAGGPAGATGTAGRPGAAGTTGRPGPAGRARAAGTAGSPGTTDERTLQELQREHGPALFSFLLGLTYGDRQRAEDLAQETLVRAWQHPEAFSDAYASIRPWLFTVARRIAIDARRSRLARPAEIGDGVLAVTPDPSDPTESAEAALDVRAAVRELSPEHRAVLVRLYFHGLTVAEAARDLGIPAGTVKSRSHYALRQLGRALPGYRPRHGTVARPRAVAAQ